MSKKIAKIIMICEVICLIIASVVLFLFKTPIIEFVKNSSLNAEQIKLLSNSSIYSAFVMLIAFSAVVYCKFIQTPKGIWFWFVVIDCIIGCCIAIFSNNLSLIIDPALVLYCSLVLRKN